MLLANYVKLRFQKIASPIRDQIINLLYPSSASLIMWNWHFRLCHTQPRQHIYLFYPYSSTTEPCGISAEGKGGDRSISFECYSRLWVNWNQKSPLYLSVLSCCVLRLWFVTNMKADILIRERCSGVWGVRLTVYWW